VPAKNPSLDVGGQALAETTTGGTGGCLCSELKAIVHASDEALNGSEWVQYFCHPTKLYKSFVKFYYEHVATEEYGISWKLSEMMRHMVAVHNTCTL